MLNLFILDDILISIFIASALLSLSSPLAVKPALLGDPYILHRRFKGYLTILTSSLR